MTLRECYQALGGNYDDVVGRLRSERLVQKFVLKFPSDGSYALLVDSLVAGNMEEAFRAAHTIKGMCGNISFDALLDSSSKLTEVLRAGDLEGGRQMLAAVTEDYRRTLDAIRQYAASIEE